MPNGPLSELSEFQAELLSDGVLSLAEYDRAISAFRQCLADSGWVIDREFLPSRNHSYFVYVRAADDSRSREGTTAASRKCSNDYTVALSFVWSQDHSTSETEMQRARDALSTCLSERGVEGLPQHPSGDDVSRLIKELKDEAIDPFVNCQHRIEDEFDMPGFAG